MSEKTKQIIFTLHKWNVEENQRRRQDEKRHWNVTFRRSRFRVWQSVCTEWFLIKHFHPVVSSEWIGNCWKENFCHKAGWKSRCQQKSRRVLVRLCQFESHTRFIHALSLLLRRISAQFKNSNPKVNSIRTKEARRFPDFR